MKEENTISVESSVQENETDIQQSRNDYFGLHQRKSNIKTEIMAGLIIFMSMFYIVPVQGAMIGGVLSDPNAVATIGIITALSAGVITIFMGLYAKHPIALASGMGVNAFVAYTLILGGMTYSAALSAVLMSGLIFIIISVTPIRERVLHAIPDDIKKAISIGVGLFLLFVALTNGGIIVQGSGTPVSLGPLNDPFVLLSIFSILLTIILWIYEVKGGVLIAMFVTAALGICINYIIPNWNSTIGTLPSLEMDWASYGASFTNIGNYFGQSFIGLGDVDNTWANPDWYLAIFVLFLNDFFDTAGTLFGINSSMGEDIEVDEKTNKRVLLVDAIGTTFGSISGTTNITVFAESTAGVQYGGRTGITAITTGCLFLLSIPIIPLLTPIFESSVTVGAVVLIGVMMAYQLKDIHVEDKVYLVSSVFTIMFMILGYSIGTGIVIGLLTFIILMLATGRWRELDLILIISSPMFLAFLILPLYI